MIERKGYEEALHPFVNKNNIKVLAMDVTRRVLVLEDDAAISDGKGAEHGGS